MIGGSFPWRTWRGSLVMSKSLGALLLLGLLTLSGCDPGGSGNCTVFFEHCNPPDSGGGTTKPTVQSIEITPPDPTLAAGTSTQLVATAIYSDNSHADVTTQAVWSTSHSAVATVSPTGETLAVSSAIGAGGALSAMSPTTVATASRPMSVTVDPSGRYAYVADYGNGTASTVSQYTIGADGTLSAMSQAEVAAGAKPFSIITTD